MRYVVCLLLLAGCTATSTWRYEENKIDIASSRLYSEADNPFFGLDFEFISLQDDTYAFIHTNSQKIPSWENDPTKAVLTITIGKRTFETICPLLKGKQQVLLPNELSELIIDGLKEKNRVHISIGQLNATLDPDTSFFEEYKKIKEGMTTFDQVIKRGTIL